LSRRGPWVWPAVLVVGLALAAGTTESTMGAPPDAWGLWALVAGVVLVVVAAAGEGSRWLGGLGIAVLALAASHDFLRPGLARGHDVAHHVWALWSLWRCVLDGDWLPRWNPYLALGIPLLQFYAPLPYMAAWPVQALGASPAEAITWLTVLGQAGTGVGLYACVRWCGGSRGAGLLGAAAGMLGPYHLMDQTFRVALGETMAFPLFAPLLVAIWKVARGERDPKAPWVIGVGACALLLTHLLSVVMVIAIGGILTAVGLARRPRSARSRRDTLVTLALTGALTLGASAAWWLPVVVEVEHTSVKDISRPGRAISPMAALPDEPVIRRLWPRYGVRRAIGSGAHPGKAMPMYFGCGLLALLGLALLTPGGRGTDDPRPWAVAGLLALLFALWPFARLLDGVPIIGRIMFPWRLYAPATVLVALAGGLAFDRWTAGLREPGRLAWLTIALAVLAWDVSPFLGAADRVDDHEGVGLFTTSGSRVIPVEGVPRDRFVRVEDARFPPSDYDWTLAMSRVVFPDYLPSALRKRYGKYSKKPSVEQSQEYGASFRIRRGRGQPMVLAPEPLVEFRPDRGTPRGLAEATVALAPEEVRLGLPEGLPEGRLRFTMSWFPGWRVQVDDGPWADAARASSLLAVRIPSGSRRVTFRYSAVRPWDRAAGLVLSGLTFVILAGVGLRRGRREWPRDDHRPRA